MTTSTAHSVYHLETSGALDHLLIQAFVGVLVCCYSVAKVVAHIAEEDLVVVGKGKSHHVAVSEQCHLVAAGLLLVEKDSSGRLVVGVVLVLGDRTVILETLFGTERCCGRTIEEGLRTSGVVCSDLVLGMVVAVVVGLELGRCALDVAGED